MDEHYAAQMSIPLDVIRDMPEDYIRHAIDRMKRDGAVKVFDEIYNLGCPVVVETHLETWDDFMLGRRYVLHYRLTAVQQRHYVMPVFEFVDHAGARNWKCPGCGIINEERASYCGELHDHPCGCGYPKGGL